MHLSNSPCCIVLVVCLGIGNYLLDYMENCLCFRKPDLSKRVKERFLFYSVAFSWPSCVVKWAVKSVRMFFFNIIFNSGILKDFFLNNLQWQVYFPLHRILSICIEKYMENKPAAQAAGQTLLDATQPVGKLHPFSKIAVTFEPIQQFRCPSRISENMPT